jgi:hypothetical protein
MKGVATATPGTTHHNLGINKQNSSSNKNENVTEMEDGDESSNLRPNKKSLSLSIANGRLRDGQKTKAGGGDAE